MSDCIPFASAASRHDDTEVARSLETIPVLLPLIPYLLQDIDELGGMFHHALPLLRTLPLGRATEALDLGCGKGAIACTLANEFGCRVHGIDWFAPFIEDARLRARRLSVDALCTFECADVRTVPPRGLTADLLVLFSVERWFGSIPEHMGTVRRLVRPGGWMVIEEMFLAPHAQSRADTGEFADEETTRRQMLIHGDRLLGWIPCPPDEFAEWNRWANASIEHRVCELIAAHPELETDLRAYADFQRAECRKLEESFCTVTVILQRT